MSAYAAVWRCLEHPSPTQLKPMRLLTPCLPLLLGASLAAQVCDQGVYDFFSGVTATVK